MKKRQLLIIASALFSTITFAQQKEPKVLFIGLDGTMSEALQLANTPTIDSLMANGISSYNSWHLGVTVSGPSWSNMLTGVWEAKHQVTNNSYSGADYANWPYMSNRMKEVRPEIKAVQILTWNPMDDASKGTGGQVYNAMWDLSIDVGNQGQDLVPQAAAIQLQDPELDFLFAYIQDNDGAGHGTGFSTTSPTYMNSIENTDLQVKWIIDALRSRPTYDQEEWLIIGCTDHGGLGFGHGGNSDQERRIWWFASAPFLIPTQIQGEGDPGSFQMPGNPVDLNKVAAVPGQADVAVTAIDHILPGLDGEEVKTRWSLDGQSWLKPEYYDSTLYVNQKGGIPGNTTGNEELIGLNNGISFYPNPVSDVLNIEREFDFNTALEVTVYSLTGNVVYQTKMASGQDKMTINTTDFPKGVYLINLSGGSVNMNSRVVFE